MLALEVTDLGLPGRLLALSRPATLVFVLAVYLAEAGASPAQMALYAVSASFFVASSAVIVDWIPAPQRLRNLALWAELPVVTLLNVVAGSRGPGIMPVLFSPLMVTFAMREDRRLRVSGVVATIACWLMTMVSGWSNTPGTRLYVVLGVYAALFLFQASIGLLIRNLTDEKERSAALHQQVSNSRIALERAHRQLQDTARRQQELAVLEERQRLAREMHDSVAHSLTALLVQIQAGRRLMTTEPERAASTIAHCETLAREALQETRRAVRALHPAGLEQQNEASALRRLGADFGAATGMVVEVTADVAAASLPTEPQRLEQLYRIFQEALTNAHRHGQASRVRAELTAANDRLHLLIHNNGTRPDSMEPGVGLRSMQERARNLGGEVRLQPTANGLTIHVTVPLGQEGRR